MNISEKDLTSARQALGNILTSARALDSAHARLHKNFDQLDSAHKAHGVAHQQLYNIGKCAKGDAHDLAHGAHAKAHESARLSRLEHKTDHGRHMTKVADAMTQIMKVLGGGPESVRAASSGPESLPSHLGTSGLSTNKNARTQSPFDKMTTAVLQKSGARPFSTRRNPNASNPMWSG